MNPNATIIKDVFIRAIIDSVPDQEQVAALLSDVTFFENNVMESIFEQLGIESLGRIWFLTILEEQVAVKIEDPEAFFKSHADQRIDEVIEAIAGGVNLVQQ